MATRAYPKQVETAWGLSAFGAVSSSGAADATVRAAKPLKLFEIQCLFFWPTLMLFASIVVAVQPTAAAEDQEQDQYKIESKAKKVMSMIKVHEGFSCRSCAARLLCCA